ncbi:MAG: cardiolipin synthase [Clostridium sp.]|nr:cardiolipin synthase [Clostridium sp.]
MRGIIKFVRSHFFWCIVISLAALALMMTQYIYSYRHFLPGWYFSEACFVGLLIFIINRDEEPEFKLVWLTIMFVLRLPAVLIYIICTSTNTNRKFFQNYHKAAGQIEDYYSQQVSRKVSEPDDPAAALQLHYLSGAAHSTWVHNSNVKYYPLGEDFHADLLNALEQAKRFIFMEYFIISGGKMWDSIHDVLRRKAAIGLDVYLMYDDIGCAYTLPTNYCNMLEKEGIHAIRTNHVPLIALSRLSNNRDHRKIIIIDGEVGFTGGINLADEYINAIVKHGHWKDTAVRITGNGTEHLTVLFLNMWNSQNKLKLAPEKYLREPVNKPVPDAGIIFSYGTGPEPFYQDNIGKNMYLNMINVSQRYCYITTPYLICDHELLNALRLASKKGVDVRIITPHIPDKRLIFWITRSNYATLIADGVRIFEYTPGFIHAKTIVCDDKFAICGTINMDYRSLNHHFEAAVWMYRTACIDEMKKDFMKTQEVSGEISAKQARLPFLERISADIVKLFAPLL